MLKLGLTIPSKNGQKKPMALASTSMDGRNPAPVLSHYLTGFQPSKVVQDFATIHNMMNTSTRRFYHHQSSIFWSYLDIILSLSSRICIIILSLSLSSRICISPLYYHYIIMISIFITFFIGFFAIGFCIPID